MQLLIHVDSTYPVAAKVRSRIAGYLFFSDTPENPLQFKPKHNVDVHIKSQFMKHVAASAAEAACGALFHNAQLLVPIKITLEEFIHKHLTTPLITNNSTEALFDNKEIKQKCSKIWDMIYHWIRDKVEDKTFYVNW